MVHRKTISGLFAAATLTGALALPAASSAESPSWGLKDAYDTVYERVDDQGGQPGRHIVDDGVREDGDPRAATRSEVKESLATLRSMAGTPADGAAADSGASTAAATTGTTSQSTSSGASGSASSTGGSTAGAGLEGVAACESGGDPSAVSADGQYRGKYQFDQQTWESVGGSGDPAAASEGEQDQRAATLQSQRGSSPWPVCGG